MDRLAVLLDMERDKPQDPFVKYALALEYLSRGNEAESRAYFERLVSDFGHYLPTYFQFGKLEENSGNKERARALYTKGIELAKEAKEFKTVWELEEALDFIDD